MAPTITTQRFGLATKYLTTKRLRKGDPNSVLERDSQSVQNNEIKDLNDLRHQYKTCGIVAIDTEPWKQNMQLVHEIGLSFLPPLSASEASIRLPPDNFASFLVPTYTIAIIGRRSPVKGNRERLNHGPFLPTFPEDVEDGIIKILEMFLSTMPTRPPLILTGFDLTMEMKVLKNQYPRILPHFWAWADVQQHCTNMVTITNRRGRAASAKISMRDTLIALGYREDAAVGTLQHRAGNDTARVIALFLHLVNRPPDVPRLQLKLETIYSRRHIVKARKGSLFDTRPYPVEEYPFTAKLSRSGAVMPPRHTILAMRALAAFNIIALGIRPQEESPRLCWICLPSIQVLRRFVQHVNSLGPSHSQKCPGFKRGCRCDPSDLSAVWEAEMCLPPGTEGWTDQRLEEMRDQAKEEARARKTLEDQAKREMRKENRSVPHQGGIELEEEGCCISWGDDDDSGDGGGKHQSDPDSPAGDTQEAGNAAGGEASVVERDDGTDLDDDSDGDVDDGAVYLSDGCDDDVDDMAYLIHRIEELELLEVASEEGGEM